MTRPPSRPVTRLRDIAPAYRLFFVDQFGVLRDSQAAYPGAIEALRQLRAEGRKVVIVSNSGKRSAPNEERMERLGFERASWDLFLSSGEVAWRMLAARPASERPKRCLILARDGDVSPIEGLGIAVAESAAEADLVLIAGSEAPDRTLADYQALLEPAAARKVPALCINPDMTMLVAGGTAFGAGRIARLYATLGGPVTWIGKPYPEIYRSARAIVGLDGPALGIGDSVEHDIAGAKGVGADAALVLAGIHAGEEDLEAVYLKEGARPDHVLERFVW
ncbi:TIGR01459 family HAD-type hydrolase [Labrys wisconsinensis]|uniref:HAD superfamily hydrolase (TIGR01459 family) n=1 Tax=Labrys wisconsinensis TaxID=425677 RepID=A0ABU0J5W1_9HYPH|nr:TIGR01459 family HAD-type hydrolase [Labrys wisconsinensis]MDQ0469643.1 HAD superfamily hydrolase (TIGR01459 family) [Labrys wisconsinensis]